MLIIIYFLFFFLKYYKTKKPIIKIINIIIKTINKKKTINLLKVIF